MIWKMSPTMRVMKRGQHQSSRIVGTPILFATMACLATAGSTHDAYLTARLAEVRLARGVPALTAAVFMNGHIAAKGVTGRRKQGVSSPATITDKFHIGSITKPITSTLIAELVERGILSGYGTNLNMTHPWVFTSPNWGYSQYKSASMLSYMSHVDGMPYQPSAEPADEYASYGVTNLPLRRNLYVRDAVRDAPNGAVGTKRVYAGGHIVAASMLEDVTGVRWEDLVKTYVFTPLGMTSAGFGPMSSTSSVTGPWEHSWNGSAPVARTWPANYAYEPHAPAGRNVHCSITDLVKFGASHLNASANSLRILTDSSISILRTVHWPNATNLSGEVSRMTPAWIPGTRTVNNVSQNMFWHNGDNGFNHAWLEVLPSVGTGASFAIATNVTSLTSGSPGDEAVGDMKQHCIDIMEHFIALTSINADLNFGKPASWSAGNVTNAARINDHNYSTASVFSGPNAAVKITFPSTTTVRRFHVANPDKKVTSYAVERWYSPNGGAGGWVTVATGTTINNDAVWAIDATSSTSYRLKIKTATSWPISIEEFWLLP